MQKLIDYWKNGLFAIIASSVFAQVCTFLSSVIVIRHLERIEYGEFVDANNVYSYLSVFIGLGLSISIIQFCSENRTEAEKGEIYRFTFVVGTLFNCILLFVILLIAYIEKSFGDWKVAQYLKLMCGYPLIIYVSLYIQSTLRARFKNKSFALYNSVFSFLLILGNVVFTKLWGVAGLIVSNYFAYMLSFLVFICVDYSFIRQICFNRYKLTKRLKKEIIRFSTISTITDFTAQVLVLLDITCLKLILADNGILADYKVASSIPTASLFISSCFVTYFYPQLVRKSQEKKAVFRDYIHKVLSCFIIISLFIFIFLFLMAPYIIGLVYGERYVRVVPVFRVLCINFFLMSAFRKILGNLIAAMRRIEINLLHTTVVSFINIVLNVFLIKKVGEIGAAYATVISSVLMIVFEFIFLWSFFKKGSET